MNPKFTLKDLNAELAKDIVDLPVGLNAYTVAWEEFEAFPNTIDIRVDIRGKWTATVKESGRSIKTLTGFATIYGIDDLFHGPFENCLAKARSVRHQALIDLTDELVVSVSDDELDAEARKALLVMLKDRSPNRHTGTQLAAIETVLRFLYAPSEPSAQSDE